MLKLLRRKQRKEKGRAKAREVMAQLWAELSKLERSGAVPNKVLFVVEDPALGRALEKKVQNGQGAVVDIGSLGPAVQAARSLAEAALKGIRPVLVLRSISWRGWAMIVRALLKNHVTIVSPVSFDVTTATSQWVEAPPPFVGWKMLPPNNAWALAPVNSQDAEDHITAILDEQWSGEVSGFLT